MNVQPVVKPLTPPPKDLALASKSSPWSVIWKMIGIVLLLFVIAQTMVLSLVGVVEGAPELTVMSLICSVPFLVVFFFVRRPKLTHVVIAKPDDAGTTQHLLPNSRALFTTVPTRFEHHLIKDSPPLEMPPTSTLWIVFSLTVITAFLGLLPAMLSDNVGWLFLAVIVGVPAWLFGFSLPVHAWWAFSTRHFQLMTTKAEGESMLIAGMLSTFPALVINSLLFPLLLILIGIESMDSGSIGELLLLSVSAPVGEELCKAAFVLSLYKIIDSPKRGFQVGFSVGLGFALLENLIYILSSFGTGGAITYSMTTVMRGIGSIPGHALWTGFSGVSIGWYLCTRRGIQTHTAKERDPTKWVVYDGNSGKIVDTERKLSEIGRKVRGWLYKPYDRVWSLPKNPATGISLAILGHAFWNGSLWLVSWLFIEQDIVVQVLASLVWIGILIVGLWVIGREILAAVMHLPSSIRYQ